MVLTANAAKYVQWQCRVMYYWYKKRKAEQGPDGQMGGFTRVLHEGRGDELMEEMPTCVVDRLSQEYGFVVLSRPNALLQMLDRRGSEPCSLPPQSGSLLRALLLPDRGGEGLRRAAACGFRGIPGARSRRTTSSWRSPTT